MKVRGRKAEQNGNPHRVAFHCDGLHLVTSHEEAVQFLSRVHLHSQAEFGLGGLENPIVRRKTPAGACIPEVLLC